MISYAEGCFQSPKASNNTKKVFEDCVLKEAAKTSHNLERQSLLSQTKKNRMNPECPREDKYCFFESTGVVI